MVKKPGPVDPRSKAVCKGEGCLSSHKRRYLYNCDGAMLCYSCVNRANAGVTCTICEETVQLPTYGRGECRTCKDKKRRRRDCEVCLAFGVTERYRGQWRCARHLRDALLRFEGRYDWHLHAEAEDLLALSVRYFALAKKMFALIEFWLLPMNECLYIRVRVYIFTLYGRFAGVLQGPAGGLFTSGRGGWKCQCVLTYANHIRRLVAAKRWPLPPVRVVCAGFTVETLLAVQVLLPKKVAAQLVAYPWSLSCQPGPTKTEAPPLVDKAREVCVAVGREPTTPLALTAKSVVSAVFCSVLYP
jgi:hypothetical protein